MTPFARHRFYACSRPRRLGAHSATSRLVRSILGVATILGGVVTIVALPATTAGASTMVSFAYTGGEQSFSVPSDVSQVSVTAIGAAGAKANGSFGSGGEGAEVVATVAVTASSTLYVEVGGPGLSGTCDLTIPVSAFNGGGSTPCGGGGGGASDVQTCSVAGPSCRSAITGSVGSDPRLVTAGGGGGSSETGANGGNAGTAITGPGAGSFGSDIAIGGNGGNGGKAGTTGGSGGSGTPGESVNGGPGSASSGGSASSAPDPFNAAGAGGGGWFGGGAGGDGDSDGGGGGAGSSYPTSTVTTASTTTPSVSITYLLAAPVVSSILRVGASPSNASSDAFTVTFSEPVSGVVASDFTATASNTVADIGITVTPVSSSVYTVNVIDVSGDGTLRLDLDSGSSIENSDGVVISGGYTAGAVYTIVHSAPAVTSVGVPANGTYIAGQNLDVEANFSEAVTVTGTPQIPITLDTGGTVEASYLSGSGTTVLTFRYTVVGGEQDLNGITVGSSIVANGGTIEDAATNHATLTLNSVGSTSGVLVDSIPPAVSSVGVPANGTYGTGQTLGFGVNFDKSVLVTGSPYLSVTLDTGGTVHAPYAGGSGTSTLTFSYAVVAGNDDTTGVTLGAAIVANGGTIKDAATNAAVLTLNDVGSTTGVLVDAIAPTVSSIDRGDSSPTNLQTIHFAVSFSAPVNGVDTSDFSLVGSGSAAGSISSVSGSGSTYTVTVGSVSGDGTLRLDLINSGDAISDNFGNTLTAAHTGDQSYSIRTTAPAVTSVRVPGNATYVAGQNLDFTATFDEAVTVTGTPRIAVTVSIGGPVFADYISGSGSSTLTFRYTVVPGVQDLVGIQTANSITLNGGTIEDAATNEAALSLTGEPSTAGIDIDSVVPSISSVELPVNRTYGSGQDLEFTLDFTKAVTVDTTGGTPWLPITLDTGGAVRALYISGSGTSSLVFLYVVVPGNLDTDGITVGSSLVMNGGTIKDPVGNNTATTLPGIGSTTQILVDAIAPTVTSIDTAEASTNNFASEAFTVTFSTDVSLSPPDTTDFNLHESGSASGSVASVNPVTGSVYTVSVSGVSGDGSMRLDLNTSGSTITDAFGNELIAAHQGDESYSIEHTAPVATAMTVPSNGTSAIGAQLGFTVSFSEPVTVTGTPRLAIDLTGATAYADYSAGGGTSTLTFTYTVGAGDLALGGISTGTALDTNGGSIADAASNNAVLIVSTVEPSTAGIDVDAVGPAVVAVAVPADARYGPGQNLDFTVDFAANVTVTGAPYLTLDLTSGMVHAAYLSGSGTSALTFGHVVAAPDQDLSGLALGPSITLGSATIGDTLGDPAVLSLNGVASTSGVLVDTVEPIVSSIVTVGATTTAASTDQFSVTFSEPVIGVSASDFALHSTATAAGTVSTVTTTTSGPATFLVTVSAISGSGSLRLDLTGTSGDITDLFGNALTASFSGGAVLTIEQAPAAVVAGVTSVSPPGPGRYVTGQHLVFSVTFSAPVSVSGTPRLGLVFDLGGGGFADYAGGSGTQVLSFDHVVQTPEVDWTGLVLSPTIDLDGGSITDAAGASANTSLGLLPSTSAVLLNQPANAPPPTYGGARHYGAPVSTTLLGATVSLHDSAGAYTAVVLVPSGALPVGTILSMRSVKASAAALAAVPKNDRYRASFAVTWTSPGGAMPRARHEMTIRLSAPAIEAGDSVYETTAHGVRAVGVAEVKGKVTISFETDPIFLVVGRVGLELISTLATVSGLDSPSPTVGLRFGCRGASPCAVVAKLSVARVSSVKDGLVTTHVVIAAGQFTLAAGTTRTVELAETPIGSSILTERRPMFPRYRMTLVTVLTSAGRVVTQVFASD